MTARIYAWLATPLGFLACASIAAASAVWLGAR